jgi:hypothetical protein
MGGVEDFDFLIGDWRVEHRQLATRLAGSDTWLAFGGVCSVRKILGGQGNADENLIEKPEGAYRAATIRAFEPATGLWRIWWLDARAPIRLDPPMVGRFENGAGVFLGDDVFEGRPILVRFLWTPGAAPRWRQAFSPDGGDTWETNWIMDFRRAG